MNRTPVSWLAVGMLLLPSVLIAATGAQPASHQPAGQTKKQDTDTTPPDPALLEFLGEWETKDGKWFDPTQLEDSNMPQRQDNAADKQQGERHD